jgi:hypothetical protein
MTAAATLLGVAPRSALADDAAAVPGVYEVTYAEVSNNCSAGALTFSRGTITIGVAGGKISVEIDGVPKMVGPEPRAGKIKAQSEGDPSRSAKAAKFSIGGKVDAGVVKLVFDAEHYADKKPSCTQSWTVTGKKKGT